MALFQHSVLKKYLSGIDEQTVDDAWETFTAHFHNPEIQQNIRSLKEESYQEGFLDHLFVNVLGYTKNPTPNYNLVVEQKNLTDSKKADGALLDGDKVRGVIELKGTETTDLSKVEDQAFGYRNKQPDALYVIISNFEKLRFYIDNAVDFIEFNLFNLSKEEFKVLWLCLGYANFARGLPKKIKDASLTEEENVTKKLYKDYSKFKHDIFESVKKHNPDYDPLLLFKKTQKLLDRFLFIFFAEDRNLLPPNSIRKIIQQWQQLKELDEYRPLYERFVKYFGYLNNGRNVPGKDEIFAYNGGLFAEDEILDNLAVSDDLLYKHTLQLSKYDFVSEVDVNILGHIFEHSLNEIEEINAELKGEEVDTSKTRRKKDGVYYTPKYITKYIVENTVGKLCEERKTELEIDDEEYRPNRQTKTKKPLLAKLDNYRHWLLDLTICDPACGSGAFLNQALEFLIDEHTYLDELQAKLLGESIVFPDIENQILENNLFGVDINEESVEIAKLSLWLRTAQKGRKLTSLNHNIKCGNSLIDDPGVAGDKAFDWEAEFPSVFENGGFDVVIGNPPYLAGREWSKELKDQRSFFKGHYSCMTDQYDLYALFIQKGQGLVRNDGLFSFITPNTWLMNDHYNELRKWVLKNFGIELFADFTDVNVFEDATVLTIIFVLRNEIEGSKKFTVEKFSTPFISQEKVNSTEVWKTNDNLLFNLEVTLDDQRFLENIENGSKKIEDFADVKFGVKVYQKGKGKPKQDGSESKEKIFEKETKEGDDYLPYLRGRSIKSFYNKEDTNWLKYGEHLAEPRDIELFEGGRILVRRITGERLIVCPIEETKIADQLLHTVKPDFDYNHYVIAVILHSSAIRFYFKKKFGRVEKTFPEIRVSELKSLPIKYPEKESDFITVGKRLEKLTSDLEKHRLALCNLLLSKFDIEKLSRKLQSWHELTFKQFLKELKKKKVKLNLEEEAEWLDYFNKQKAQAEELKSQIAQTDAEIDAMVYELYGLTEEEVQVVEGNID